MISQSEVNSFIKKSLPGIPSYSNLVICSSILSFSHFVAYYYLFFTIIIFNNLTTAIFKGSEISNWTMSII